MNSSQPIARSTASGRPTHRSLNFCLGLILLSLSAGAAAGAVGLTLTPNTTVSTSSTPVVLHVTGLTPGETIVVKRFVDVNANGLVDTGESLAEVFAVADGQVSFIGGVRNPNLPGDEDLAADGQITISLAPSLRAELGRLAGSQVIRVQSPTSAFADITIPLTITQPSHAQSFTGTVRDGVGAVVPGAGVVLLNATTDGEFVLGVVADGAGVFTVYAPVGSYLLLPVKAGYVAGLGTPVTLGSGAALTQNLSLTAATTSISGKIADAATPSAGLGGVQLFVGSTTSDAITIISTNGNGTYSVPVTAGSWKIEVSEVSLDHLGYLNTQNKPTVAAGTSGGAANINLPKVTALIYGTVTNSSAQPLAGIQMGANDNTHGYSSHAITDASGYYVLGAATGDWNAFISSSSPGLAGYIIPSNQSVSITGTQAVSANFSLFAVNAHLQGVVTKVGVPVASLQLNAYNQSNNQSISTTTALDGSFDLGLAAGTWRVQVESTSAASLGIVGPLLDYTLGLNQTTSGITIAVKAATTQISGHIRDSLSAPITGANVYANATINGVSYIANAQTDPSGYYTFPIIDGTWQVGVFANNFTTSNLVSSTISGSPATLDFTLTKTAVITNQPVNQTAAAGQTIVFSINFNGAGVNTQWQVSTNGGTTWADLANDATYGNVTSSLLNITANAGLNGFLYRCVATNSFGTVPSNSALLTVLTPLQSWRQANFGTTDNIGSASDTADPDGDGTSNLLEYALGMNPNVADSSGLPLVGTNASHLNLTLTITRGANTTSLTYTVEATSDLTGAWTTIYSTAGVSVGDQVTVTDPQTLTGTSRRFLRLRVTSP